LLQPVPWTFVGQEVLVRRLVQRRARRLFGQLRAPRRVFLGHLTPIELVDGFGGLDQLGHDLLVLLAEQRAVVVDDRARQLRQALRRVRSDVQGGGGGGGGGSHGESDCKRRALHGGGF